MAEMPETTLNSIVDYLKKSDLCLQIGDTTIDMLPEVAADGGEQFQLFDETQNPAQHELFADLALRTDHPIIRFSGQVSSSFRKRIIDAWEHLHGDLKRGLIKRGVSVYTPHSILEYRMQHTDKLLISGGFYDTAARRIVVPQLDVWASSLLVPKLRVVASLYHEIGHALDFTLNMLSEKDGFRRAYKQDIADIPGEKERYFWYYLWTNNCEQEAFAEAWAQQSLKAFGCRENTYDPEFEAHFPKTWAWVESNVPSAKDGFFLPQKTINKSDEAERTPIENLETEIDDHEFAQILQCGVNPLRLNPSTATSLIDRCIDRNQPRRVREIVLQLSEHPLLKSGLFADYHIAAIRRTLGTWRLFLDMANITDAETRAALKKLSAV